MIKLKINEYLNIEVLIYAGTLTLLSVFMIIDGPIIYGDSNGYLNMSPKRSAGYPLFLYLFRIFGDYQLYAVIIVQCIINIAALTIFIHYICRLINVPKYGSLFILPVVSYMYFVERYLYNTSSFFYQTAILTEALSIPIFLIIAIFLIESVLQKKYRYLIIGMAMNSVLILIRSQFLFMYPIAFLLIVYIYFHRRDTILLLKVSAIIFVIAFSHQLFNKTYNYILFGEFTSSLSANLSFVTNALYVSEYSDINFFYDPEERELFDLIFTESYEKNLLKISYQDSLSAVPGSLRRGGNTRQINHYSNSFNDLLHRTVNPIIENYYSQYEGIELRKKINEKVDVLATTLTKRNWKKVLKNNTLDILVSGFHNYLHVIIFLSLFFLSLYGIYKNSMNGKIITLFMIIHILNLIIVSIGGRVIPRYYEGYSGFALFVIITAIIIKTILTKTERFYE